MYKIKVITSFSAAHFLRNYKGKCENLHGHNWKIEVLVASDKLDKSGMVMDFGDLKRISKDVLSDFDHKILNDINYFKERNPSSEEIAKYIYGKLSKKIKAGKNRIVEVKVWETDTACASYQE